MYSELKAHSIYSEQFESQTMLIQRPDRTNNHQDIINFWL